jgi:YidC/Oxa1 family membrane protein insertase
MEQQRILLYIALAFTLYLIWQAWQEDYGPRPAPSPTTQTTAAAGAEGAPPDAPAAPDLPEATESVSAKSATGSAASGGDVGTVHVSTDVLDLELSLQGGDFVRADLPTYPVSLDEPDEPVRLFEQGERVYVAQTGLLAVGADPKAAAESAPSHHARFRSERTRYALAEGQEILEVPLVWTGPDGVRVTKTYVFRRGSFLVEVRYRIENPADQPWRAFAYQQLRHSALPDSGATKYFGVYTFTGAAYYDGSYRKVAFSDMEEEPLKLTVEGGWIAMLRHYFFSAFIGEPGVKYTVYSRVVPQGTDRQYIIGMSAPPVTVAPGGTLELSTRLWVGPKLQKQLATIAPGLELVTDYGIFTVISKPLFWLLDKIHGLVGNWGWAIVLLTLLIKLAFYKLSEASYRSMARMRAVQPRLVALKERYGDDKQRLNQALMELYKTEKINPLGGCLPILVQIPVFIGLYWMLLETVELRQAPFVLWIRDLSAPDPYFVLPVLMGVTMFVQQKLNPAPPDPIQAKIMMALPFVFTVFFAFFPSGLVLYWLVNNLLSILQQWWITRRIEAQAAKA